MTISITTHGSPTLGRLLLEIADKLGYVWRSGGSVLSSPNPHCSTGYLTSYGDRHALFFDSKRGEVSFGSTLTSADKSFDGDHLAIAAFKDLIKTASHLTASDGKKVVFHSDGSLTYGCTTLNKSDTEKIIQKYIEVNGAPK